MYQNPLEGHLTTTKLKSTKFVKLNLAKSCFFFENFDELYFNDYFVTKIFNLIVM